ncbi:TcdA/TcdB catalytic glycosyltransferase domain-containing protein [Streptomyces mirabilis]
MAKQALTKAWEITTQDLGLHLTIRDLSGPYHDLSPTDQHVIQVTDRILTHLEQHPDQWDEAVTLAHAVSRTLTNDQPPATPPTRLLGGAPQRPTTAPPDNTDHHTDTDTDDEFADALAAARDDDGGSGARGPDATLADPDDDSLFGDHGEDEEDGEDVASAVPGVWRVRDDQVVAAHEAARAHATNPPAQTCLALPPALSNLALPNRAQANRPVQPDDPSLPGPVVSGPVVPAGGEPARGMPEEAVVPGEADTQQWRPSSGHVPEGGWWGWAVPRAHTTPLIASGHSLTPSDAENLFETLRAATTVPRTMAEVHDFVRTKYAGRDWPESELHRIHGQFICQEVETAREALTDPVEKTWLGHALYYFRQIGDLNLPAGGLVLSNGDMAAPSLGRWLHLVGVGLTAVSPTLAGALARMGRHTGNENITGPQQSTTPPRRATIQDVLDFLPLWHANNPDDIPIPRYATLPDPANPGHALPVGRLLYRIRNSLTQVSREEGKRLNDARMPPGNVLIRENVASIGPDLAVELVREYYRDRRKGSAMPRNYVATLKNGRQAPLGQWVLHVHSGQKQVSKEKYRKLIDAGMQRGNVLIRENVTAVTPDLAVDLLREYYQKNPHRSAPPTHYAADLANDRQAPLGLWLSNVRIGNTMVYEGDYADLVWVGMPESDRVRFKEGSGQIMFGGRRVPPRLAVALLEDHYRRHPHLAGGLPAVDLTVDAGRGIPLALGAWARSVSDGATRIPHDLHQRLTVVMPITGQPLEQITTRRQRLGIEQALILIRRWSASGHPWKSDLSLRDDTGQEINIGMWRLNLARNERSEHLTPDQYLQLVDAGMPPIPKIHDRLGWEKVRERFPSAAGATAGGGKPARVSRTVAGPRHDQPATSTSAAGPAADPAPRTKRPRLAPAAPARRGKSRRTNPGAPTVRVPAPASDPVQEMALQRADANALTQEEMDWLAGLGHVAVPVPADGDCLWASIADQIPSPDYAPNLSLFPNLAPFPGLPNTSVGLRHALADALDSDLARDLDSRVLWTAPLDTYLRNNTATHQGPHTANTWTGDDRQRILEELRTPGHQASAITAVALDLLTRGYNLRFIILDPAEKTAHTIPAEPSTSTEPQRWIISLVRRPNHWMAAHIIPTTTAPTTSHTTQPSTHLYTADPDTNADPFGPDPSALVEQPVDMDWLFPGPPGMGVSSTRGFPARSMPWDSSGAPVPDNANPIPEAGPSGGDHGLNLSALNLNELLQNMPHAGGGSAARLPGGTSAPRPTPVPGERHDLTPDVDVEDASDLGISPEAQVLLDELKRLPDGQWQGLIAQASGRLVDVHPVIGIETPFQQARESQREAVIRAAHDLYTNNPLHRTARPSATAPRLPGSGRERTSDSRPSQAERRYHSMGTHLPTATQGAGPSTSRPDAGRSGLPAKSATSLPQKHRASNPDNYSQQPEILMSAEELTRALHAETDTSAFEEDFGLLGPDLFRLRQHPVAPAFLAEFDYRKLAPQGVAAFFNKISLTRPAPSPEEMAPGGFTGGPVLTAHMPGRPWATPLYDGAPPHMAQLPLIRYAIWLGGPLKKGGATGQFRQRVESAATAVGDSVAVVLLTDVPRRHFDRARTTPPPRPQAKDPLADVRDMMSWAQRVGVDLVHPDELFPHDNPMELRAQYATELAKQVGPGYAAASDILRLEVINRFGGMYIDGDDMIAPTLTDEITMKWPGASGYFINPNTNNMFIAPAGHRFVRKYINGIRVKYTQSQVDLNAFGNGAEIGKAVMRLPMFFFDMSYRHRRTSVMMRTGPEMMVEIESPEDRSSMPRIESITIGAGNSWFDTAIGSGESKQVRLPRAEVVQRVVRVAATLIRDLHNREGDLHLTLVAPAVERLPDPGAAWEAVLGFIAQTPPLAALVRTVTLHKLNMRNERVTVELPEPARRLLAFDDTAAKRSHQAGLTPGKPAWVLAEIVQPARLLTPNEKSGPDARPHNWLSSLNSKAPNPD